MKALEYLYKMKKANDEMGINAININEAIEELENISSLQSTMSCDDCKYYVQNKYHDCEFEDCLRYPLLRGFTDMYEAKENK